nr:MAG TPA: hypothetical protein [Caudoviricetes sp.]
MKSRSRINCSSICYSLPVDNHNSRRRQNRAIVTPVSIELSVYIAYNRIIQAITVFT